MAKKPKQPEHKKPYPDFPLTAHPSGYWVKKHLGKQHYFGAKWCSPNEALEEFHRQWPLILEGRTPTVSADGITVRDGANLFLEERDNRVRAGRLARSTWREYETVCKRLVTVVGGDVPISDLRPRHFTALRDFLDEHYTPRTVSQEIQKTRTVFKYLYEADEIDRPVRFGPNFKRVSAGELRKAAKQRPAKELKAEEIVRLVEIAPDWFRPTLLLGINCGFGNTDCALLPRKAVDLDGGWIRYTRNKTGVDRSCPLWPETVDALRQYHEQRPRPKGHEAKDRFFLTPTGVAYGRRYKCTIAPRFRKLVDQLGIHRHGVGFYALRHMFETVGGRTKDQVAVNHIMGHAVSDIASVYREWIDDERLVAVTDAIREWIGYAKPASLKRSA